MIPIIYRSSDPSAPVLTGVVGSLTTLLDACLVSGYGSKAALGWTIAFTATNKRSYQQPAGSGFFLDVDDTGPGTGGAREAIVRGWEVESALQTGTGSFPTVAQVASNVPNWRKSATLDATPRGWILVGDDRTFYLVVADGDSTGSGQALPKMYTFGDFYSLKTGDTYKCGITVKTSANSASNGGTLPAALTVNFGGVLNGFYVPRDVTGSGTSAALSVKGAQGAFESVLPGPNLDGFIYTERIPIALANNYLRGWFRGLHPIVTPFGINDGDTMLGAGDYSGRTFYVIKNIANVNAALAVETTPWEASA